ncbi:MAG: hypothetical protein ACTSRP_15085, partial [Candidatus Helarchaeota archaeon]
MVLHIFFPPWLNSPIKQGIDALFTDFFGNINYLLPFIGIIGLGALVTFYGLFFLASFGTNYKVKDLKYENISI